MLASKMKCSQGRVALYSAQHGIRTVVSAADQTQRFEVIHFKPRLSDASHYCRLNAFVKLDLGQPESNGSPTSLRVGEKAKDKKGFVQACGTAVGSPEWVIRHERGETAACVAGLCGETSTERRVARYPNRVQASMGMKESSSLLQGTWMVRDAG
ncbi:hypothetical protein CCHR01_12834 [Colletotrichum chrysophilum]|uniref:Uncharacterized protein n=1 Tax=Colletotrichum chrysophilum TaxID=1836956 RepID=A0AAD9AB36_9PEZI|nr:hypothetical protein CCHR01_12834 [Colletotrichum chrysophilum]